MLNDIVNGEKIGYNFPNLRADCMIGTNPGCDTVGFSAVPGYVLLNIILE